MRLIDAEKLRLSYWVSSRTTTSTAGNYYFYSQTEVDNAPTIDAEPVKHGKWIYEAEDWRHQIEWFKCSCCDFPTSTAYKYCPNCGARMEGVEE